MRFRPPDASRLERVQGTFLNDEEISRAVRYWKGIRSLDGAITPTDADGVLPSTPLDMPHLDSITQTPKSKPLAQDAATPLSQPALFAEIEQMKASDARDELFDEAVEIVKSSGRGSVSLLQRKLRIGYSRASRLVDQLEEAGVLGPDQGGNQGRPVLVGNDEPPKAQSAPPSSPPPRIIGGTSDEDQEPPARPRVWM